MSELPTTPPAAASLNPDPRLAALVERIHDLTTPGVLRLMNAAWTPEEDAKLLIGTPEANRALILSTVAMNMAMSPDAEGELAELERFVAEAEHNEEISLQWRYAMECGAGPEPDMLAHAARHLRQVGSPTALRFVALLEAGDSPARVELQLTRWMNAGMTMHCYGEDLTRLSVEHELPAAMTEAEARAALDAMPTNDRLHYWLNPCA
jgi:hypothetical protein